MGRTFDCDAQLTWHCWRTCLTMSSGKSLLQVWIRKAAVTCSLITSYQVWLCMRSVYAEKSLFVWTTVHTFFPVFRSPIRLYNPHQENKPPRCRWNLSFLVPRWQTVIFKKVCSYTLLPTKKYSVQRRMLLSKTNSTLFSEWVETDLRIRYSRLQQSCNLLVAMLLSNLQGLIFLGSRINTFILQ